MCDRCLVTSCVTNNVVISAKKVKNMYFADLDSVKGDNIFMRAQADNTNLWHRRLGHVSTSLMNKLAAGDLLHETPKMKFLMIKSLIPL